MVWMCNVAHMLMYMNNRSPVGGFLWEGWQNLEESGALLKSTSLGQPLGFHSWVLLSPDSCAWVKCDQSLCFLALSLLQAPVAIPYRTVHQNKPLYTLSCCLSRHSIYCIRINPVNGPCSLLWSHFSLSCQEQTGKLVSSPSTSLSSSLLTLLDMPSSGSPLLLDCMPVLQVTVMVWR